MQVSGVFGRKLCVSKLIRTASYGAGLLKKQMFLLDFFDDIIRPNVFFGGIFQPLGIILECD